MKEAIFFNNNKTQTFSLSKQDKSNKEIIKEVYNALVEKGYNPAHQIIGYILSEDPTYITAHKNARNLISKVDRYELLEEMIEMYLN